MLITKLIRRIRSIWVRLVPYRIVQRSGLAASENSNIILKNQYDCIPKGCVYGPADQYLLVPKNRYRLSLLPGQKVSGDVGVGCLTEENTPDGYDLLWGDDEAVARFREEGERARDRLTKEIVDHVDDQLKTCGKIVDIGCGIGDLLSEIRSRYPNLTLAGCDFSPKGIERARVRIPDGEFLECHIRDTLPYQDCEFDIVFCTDFLEHLEYPEKIVVELVRICKPGGLVVVVVPDGDVDQFLGHLWFWSGQRLREFLDPWKASVFKLPETGELMAIIHTDKPEAL
jgi:SAM-dependent methyltransferase